jgi:hypothetical protein
MAVDSSNALLIGGASALIGFGLAYFTFKKFISDRYGKGKEKANTIYYWCGLIAMIAFGQGVGTVINEVLYSLINNSSINDDVIARGILTFIFYPGLLAIIALVVNKFFNTSSKIANNELNLSQQPSNNPTNTSISFSKNQVLVVFAIVLIACGVFFFSNDNFSFAKEKKFVFSECESCEFDGVTQKTECKKITDLGHFTVYENKVISYIKKSDGSSNVSSSPANDDKCFFNANGKFSFNCTSMSGDQSQMFQSSKEFDGKQTYRSTWLWYILVGNTPKLAQDSKLTCKMKG